MAESIAQMQNRLIEELENYEASSPETIILESPAAMLPGDTPMLAEPQAEKNELLGTAHEYHLLFKLENDVFLEFTVMAKKPYKKLGDLAGALKTLVKKGGSTPAEYVSTARLVDFSEGIKENMIYRFKKAGLANEDELDRILMVIRAPGKFL